MSPLLGVLLLAGIVLPHVLSLKRAAPGAAATIWASALALRALAVLAGVLYVALLVPRTELFAALTHWCWHAVPALLATQPGLDGHLVGDVTTVAPVALLAVSGLWASVALMRAARGLRNVVAEAAVGKGPCESVIVGGPGVLVAAAGLARPRLIVSAGALTSLDDDELAASLEHERGHIMRRHRFALVFGEFCGALSRFLPGTRLALRALRLHLERDADRWALAHRHDPEVLARAITKAAICRVAAARALELPTRSGLAVRLDELAALRGSRRGRAGGAAFGAIAALMAALALALAVAVPATAIAEVRRAGALPHAHEDPHHHCEHDGRR
jgi:Zn-dependent protease with chaperone function